MHFSVADECSFGLESHLGNRSQNIMLWLYFSCAESCQIFGVKFKQRRQPQSKGWAVCMMWPPFEILKSSLFPDLFGFHGKALVEGRLQGCLQWKAARSFPHPSEPVPAAPGWMCWAQQWRWWCHWDKRFKKWHKNPWQLQLEKDQSRRRGRMCSPWWSPWSSQGQATTLKASLGLYRLKWCSQVCPKVSGSTLELTGRKKGTMLSLLLVQTVICIHCLVYPLLPWELLTKTQFILHNSSLVHKRLSY